MKIFVVIVIVMVAVVLWRRFASPS